MSATTAHEEREAADARIHRTVLTGLLILLVLALWVRPMFSSLWLDELGSWWVIKDGAAATVDRALEYQGQSPAYYLLLWAVSAVGNAEWILRLPSLLGALATLFLVYRFTTRVVDREAARLAMLVLAGLEAFAFAASDARPYGLATLAAVGAMTALVTWFDTGGRKWGVIAALLLVVTIWFHLLFALLLVPQAAYVAVRWRGGNTAVRPRHLIVPAAVVVIGMLALLPQVVAIWERRDVVSIPAPVSLPALAAILSLPIGIVALALGVGLARTFGRVELAAAPLSADTLVLLALWFAFPPTVMWLASSLTDVQLLAPRFSVGSMPAGAILLAIAVRSLSPATVRSLVATLFAILALASYADPLKWSEDWRSATALGSRLADEDTPVLLHPAFVESARLDWFDDPKRVSYLLAPASYYELRGGLIPLPYTLSRPAERYLEGLVSRELADDDRFLLITRYPSVPYKEWFDGRLEHEGWTRRSVGMFGTIEVVRYER